MAPPSLKKMGAASVGKEGNYASSESPPKGRISTSDLGLTLLPGSQIRSETEHAIIAIARPLVTHTQIDGRSCRSVSILTGDCSQVVGTGASLHVVQEPCPHNRDSGSLQEGSPLRSSVADIECSVSGHIDDLIAELGRFRQSDDSVQREATSSIYASCSDDVVRSVEVGGNENFDFGLNWNPHDYARKRRKMSSRVHSSETLDINISRVLQVAKGKNDLQYHKVSDLEVGPKNLPSIEPARYTDQALPQRRLIQQTQQDVPRNRRETSAAGHLGSFEFANEDNREESCTNTVQEASSATPINLPQLEIAPSSPGLPAGIIRGSGGPFTKLGADLGQPNRLSSDRRANPTQSGKLDAFAADSSSTVERIVTMLRDCKSYWGSRSCHNDDIWISATPLVPSHTSSTSAIRIFPNLLPTSWIGIPSINISVSKVPTESSTSFVFLPKDDTSYTYPTKLFTESRTTLQECKRTPCTTSTTSVGDDPQYHIRRRSGSLPILRSNYQPATIKMSQYAQYLGLNTPDISPDRPPYQPLQSHTHPSGRFPVNGHPGQFQSHQQHLNMTMQHSVVPEGSYSTPKRHFEPPSFEMNGGLGYQQTNAAPTDRSFSYGIPEVEPRKRSLPTENVDYVYSLNKAFETQNQQLWARIEALEDTVREKDRQLEIWATNYRTLSEKVSNPMNMALPGPTSNATLVERFIPDHTPLSSSASSSTTTPPMILTTNTAQNTTSQIGRNSQTKAKGTVNRKIRKAPGPLPNVALVDPFISCNVPVPASSSSLDWMTPVTHISDLVQNTASTNSITSVSGIYAAAPSSNITATQSSGALYATLADPIDLTGDEVFSTNSATPEGSSATSRNSSSTSANSAFAELANKVKNKSLSWMSGAHPVRSPTKPKPFDPKNQSRFGLSGGEATISNISASTSATATSDAAEKRRLSKEQAAKSKIEKAEKKRRAEQDDIVYSRKTESKRKKANKVREEQDLPRWDEQLQLFNTAKENFSRMQEAVNPTSVQPPVEMAPMIPAAIPALPPAAIETSSEPTVESSVCDPVSATDLFGENTTSETEVVEPDMGTNHTDDVEAQDTIDLMGYDVDAVAAEMEDALAAMFAEGATDSVFES